MQMYLYTFGEKRPEFVSRKHVSLFHSVSSHTARITQKKWSSVGVFHSTHYIHLTVNYPIFQKLQDALGEENFLSFKTRGRSIKELI